MNAVVFDLELVKRFRKGQPSEIVEIGACKVDLDSGRIIDQFQIYISPRKGYIAKSTRSFINMTKKDMQAAVPFRVGIEQFIGWLGEHYYLCSWGKDDRIHLIDECIRKKIGLSWLKNYNDIQKQIGALLRDDNKNQLGLQNALELAGLEPTGLAHRGIDDAVNTARLLIKVLDRIKLQRNEVTDKEIAQFKLRLQRRRQERKLAKGQTETNSPDTPHERTDEREADTAHRQANDANRRTAPGRD